jgi:hypothetical protein
MLLYRRAAQGHNQFVADFNQHVAQYGTDLRSWTGDARMCALGMVVHMADISNVAKPRDLAVPWAGNVTVGEFVKAGTVLFYYCLPPSGCTSDQL